MFSDDTAILLSHKCQLTATDNLQKSIDNTLPGPDAWKININSDKSVLYVT